MGLINQAIDRAPVWLIKKLTATYLTLGLADIGREVGIDDVEQVREIILSMVSRALMFLVSVATFLLF